MQERTRLHISPLNSDLLPTILGQRLLHEATDISLHILETFPEKSFGYLSLPLYEADKLRKKLNGSVLKGRKMKVEEARPRKSSRIDNTSHDDSTTAKKESRSRGNKTREDGVIPAIELPKERRVQRGWAEAAAKDAGGKNINEKQKKGGKKDKKARSKDDSITGEAECLFTTKLRPNASAAAQEKDGKPKKRKRGVSDREVVVHEFENTTKHGGFLRDAAGSDGKKVVKEYVEGQGWLDESGNVVEKEVKKRRKSGATDLSQESNIVKENRSSHAAVNSTQAKSKADGSDDDQSEETSSSGSSDSENEADSEVSSAPVHSIKTKSSQGHIKGLGISTNGDEDLQTTQVERLSISRSSSSPVPHIDTQDASVPSTEVHPLEALFKRPNAAASHTQTPKKPHLEVSTSFSFFDPDANEVAPGNSSMLMPQTPFSQQDIRHRRQRSAAPTPDTAAPGKTFGDVWGTRGMDDVDSLDEDDAEGQVPAATDVQGDNKGKGKEQDEKQESEFSKWFWEHRGENNRAWKRRRRDAAKEKRAKDNREMKD